MIFICCYFDGSYMTGDFFNRTHKNIRDDGNSQETPHQSQQIKNHSTPNGPCVLANERQDQTFVMASVVININNWTLVCGVQADCCVIHLVMFKNFHAIKFFQFRSNLEVFINHNL